VTRRRPHPALLAAGAALAAWAGWIEPRRLVVRRETLRLDGWPRGLDGLRAGVMADLHAGVPHMGRAAIARAVETLNAERPDLVLLLGDYVDASPLWGGRLAPEAIAAELAALEAPLGRFAVLGNHDWKRAPDRMWTALTATGIEVLENRAVAVDAPGGRLWVAGLADLRHRSPDLALALRDVPDRPGEPVLLLSHDPDLHPLVPARVALTLAGHIHGGQVAIPLLRRPAIPSRYGERYARRHHLDGGRRLYVSSGLGTSGMPVRLLAPPEVVVLELRG
jgi:predicted MPP superfamily phosphohydrolase